ncbi:Interleukin-17C [Heterocephalus glaber]|uniref:Interleukin-17C n=1 Tax=Heterocephalus glaber TaxID=10181 RepID=G5C2U5_HETGA|nr:Interleukin-17C [Heterocephalus glaber]
MPAAASTASMMLLRGILFLAWLPGSLAHQGPPLWGTPRCYSAEELPHGQVPLHLLARNARWEQALPVALVPTLEAAGSRPHKQPQARTQCPTLRPEKVLQADTHERSISPWRYRTGRETAALNSVPLHQNLLVLRRRACAPTPGAFAFHTEFIRVPVGCTCVLPRSAQ